MLTTEALGGIVISRLNRDRADRKSSLVVQYWIPHDARRGRAQRSCIDGLPDTSVCTADENRVAGRVCRIDSNGGRAAGELLIILGAGAAGVLSEWCRPERAPSAAIGDVWKWCYRSRSE